MNKNKYDMNEEIIEAIVAVEKLNYAIYHRTGLSERTLSVTTDGHLILISWGEFTLHDGDDEIRMYDDTADEYEPFIDAIIREMENVKTQLEQALDCVSL